MGTWALIQIVFDIFIALGFFVTIMRLSRAPKDDPRMSRGLQLLQSKISVLEDLSDRTEVQVGQLTAILEQKSREVQAKVQLAEQHVHAIRVSMDRSLEVAKIFQDKIPHQEIIERQNTIKYVQAARLAHQGLNAEQIGQQVDLPKGEIEFIAKVNRERLMFNEDQLPTWAQERAKLEELENNETSAAPQASAGVASELSGATADEAHAAFAHTEDNFNAGRLRAEMELAEHQRLVDNLSRLQFEMQTLDFQLARETPIRNMAAAFEAPTTPSTTLSKLGEEFRKACEEAQASDGAAQSVPAASLFAAPLTNPTSAASMTAAEKVQAALSRGAMASRLSAQQAQDGNAELEAARALARGADALTEAPVQAAARPAVRAPHLVTSRSASHQAAHPPVIKRVEFPKIN